MIKRESMAKFVTIAILVLYFTIFGIAVYDHYHPEVQPQDTCSCDDCDCNTPFSP